MLCIMNATDPLPGDLSRGGFRFDAAIAAGVPRQHLYRVELQRPFHRMRCIDVDLDDHLQLCTALACLLPPGAFFSHRSAAIIHGLPVPRSALPPTPEISVFEPDRPPEISGVSAHQLTYSGQRSSSIEGLQVIGPEDAWAQLSASLSVIELVVVGDMLITGSEPYSGAPPLSDRGRLADAVRRHGRRRGVRSLRIALERIRYGSLSPQESRLRMALQDAGLPEPALNHRVEEDGRVVAMIDLAYPEEHVAIEYLGDHHRSE